MLYSAIFVKRHVQFLNFVLNLIENVFYNLFGFLRKYLHKKIYIDQLIIDNSDDLTMIWNMSATKQHLKRQFHNS